MLREVNSNGYVKSLIVLAAPCVLYRIHGFFETAGATDFYIQVFDSLTVPVENAEPLESYQAQANFEFNVHIGEGLTLKKGCVIVLSSTASVKTIATQAGDNADIFSNIEEYTTLSVMPVTSSTGPLATAVLQQVWAEAAGPKRLVRLQVTDTSAVAGYVQLFAQDAPEQNVSVPIRQWVLGASASLDLDFGLNGIPVYSADGPNGPYRLGCSVGFSHTSGVYDAAGTGTLTGTYITPTEN